MSNRFLSKNEVQRLRRHAKKMGATDIQLSCLDYDVRFGQTGVSFAFKPLKYHTSLYKAKCAFPFVSDFETETDIERIANEMRKCLEFIEYLKEFEKTIDP